MSQEATQLMLHQVLAFPNEAYAYGDRTSGERHGVVLTKPHVVELILDLVGYSADEDLATRTLLEPACGHGVFLIGAVDRLCASRDRFARDWGDLYAAVRAFDIDDRHVELSRHAIATQLRARGASRATAVDLARAWIGTADFLLTGVSQADFVVGNPPYVRIEHLAPELQSAYRTRFSTLYDRADLYVAFIEHGLAQLSSSGLLAFICADRWILNRYGKRLRALIASDYRVEAYVDLHQASPFESNVIAYPSIFALSRRRGPRGARVARLSTGSPDECVYASQQLRSDDPDPSVDQYPAWFKGDEPWVLTSPRHLAALRELEGRFGTLEEEGATRVGIGVATGNDDVFIVPEGEEIEPDRLVRLVMRDDIDAGTIRDAGRHVINAFECGAGTVDLAKFPLLAAYLDRNAEVIRGRHVARKNPQNWFRTIDRVYPDLAARAKLLIPDIAGSLQVTFDPGRYYPHHNLYYVVSDEWDLEVLGALLSSRVALFFVASYAVRMRGGYLRFQAQYLRRIRVPRIEDLGAKLRRKLRSAFRERDFGEIDDLALRAYGLTELPPFEFVDTRS